MIQFQGKGRLEFDNGDIYVGQIEAGRPNGMGVYKWQDGSCYEGQFSNGVRHGFGSWASSNGKSYRGTYQNDRRCGFGVFVWPSGAVYEGNFFDDLRQGFGTLTWPQGTTYKGCWNQGRRHGQGVVIEKDGQIISEGYFENDQLVSSIGDDALCIRCNSALESRGRTLSSIEQKTYHRAQHSQGSQHSQRETHQNNYLSHSIDDYIQMSRREQRKPQSSNIRVRVQLKPAFVPWIPNGISRLRRTLYK